jgi:hypothetical protein
MRRGRYYLGRVLKLGLLDQARLVQAIRDSAVVSLRNYTWTITDILEETLDDHPYVFGKLSKFSQEGHFTVVDEENKSQLDAIAPNLLQASSPFVYLPDYSGIAYLHVWNGITEDVFRRRFKAIIEATYDNFFVDCTIEPIADYRTFVKKVSRLTRLREISAKVHPPNPLFGRIWGDLDSYIRRRNVDEVVVKETKEGESGIQSQVVVLINAILQQPDFNPDEPADITDAALLMAADGYGTGKVIGEEGDSFVTVKTGDTQKSFLFDKMPVPSEFARIAKLAFDRISTQRDMRHRGEE